MASIRKRPNGKWQASVYFGKNELGKKTYKYITRSTLRECRRAAWDLEQTKKVGAE